MNSEAKTYLSLRLLAPLSLSFHFALRWIFPEPNIPIDLILYNLTGIFIAFTIYYSPQFNDRSAQIALAAGIAIWSIGSFISTFNAFYEMHLPPVVIDISYSLFYPLILFGLIRTLTSKRRITSVELLESIIITLGASSILAALLLKPAMLSFEGSAASVYFSILYPLGDLVLVSIALALFFMQSPSARAEIFLLGILIFATTDLYFLWASAHGNYAFAALTDDGWLLGLAIMGEALWHGGGGERVSERITALAATTSLVMSSGILIFAAMNPTYFPSFVLIPCIATITLAFFRMSLALRRVRISHEDQELARIDELTGLPNRRRFLAELEKLRRKEGSLLLLDLDGFKPVNDLYGHAIGDLLLRHIAERFSRIITEDGLLARLGGDEFGVIIYGEPHIASEIAHALRASLSYPITVSGHVASVGVSIGHVINNDESTSEVLLRRADHAMYEAKRSGLGILAWPIQA